MYAPKRTHQPKPRHQPGQQAPGRCLPSLCACVCSPPREHTTLLSSLPHATQRGQRHAVWAGQPCPAHTSRPARRAEPARTRQSHPRQDVSAKQAERRGGETLLSHHPTSAPTPKAQTPTRTRAVAQTPHPTTHRANTPTTSLSKHAPKRTQGTCPHSSVWAHQV